MIEKIKKDLYNCRIAIIFVILYLLFMQIMFSTWCPIKAIFHIDCPGCGLTHAVIYLFQGNVVKAFHTNYTVFLWCPLIVLLFINRYVHRVKFIYAFFIFTCIITLVRYVYIIFNGY